MNLRTSLALIVTALAGCPMLVPPTSTPTAATADTHTAEDTSGDTESSTETADTAVSHTGDTGTALECDPEFSAECVVVDGECRDPLAGPYYQMPTATDDYIDQSIQTWIQSGCGPLAWVECDAGGIVRAAWGLVETGTVDVFDGTTREWVGGFLLTDVPYPVCGTQIWIGDDAHIDCAREVYDWVVAMNASCSAYPGPCNVTRECLRDEVPR